MTQTLLSSLYKDLNIPKELKGSLSKCLGVEIPVEVKKVDRNKITIQIENAFSGLIYSQEKFNKNNTIKEMKKQVVKLLESIKKEILYDLRVYNETREEITNDESDKIETLFKENDYPVLAVSFNTGNILMKLLEKYHNKPLDWDPNKNWDWDYISENPNITMEFIEKNRDKIYFSRLSRNKFNYKKK